MLPRRSLTISDGYAPVKLRANLQVNGKGGFHVPELQTYI